MLSRRIPFSHAPSPITLYLFFPFLARTAGVATAGVAGSSANGNGQAVDGERGDQGVVVASPVHFAHGVEAERAGVGDVRELFHTPVLRRVTICV